MAMPLRKLAKREHAPDPVSTLLTRIKLRAILASPSKWPIQSITERNDKVPAFWAPGLASRRNRVRHVGAWGGLARTMPNRLHHCSARSTWAAISSIPHGGMARGIAKDCWGNSFAQIRKRNSTPRRKSRPRRTFTHVPIVPTCAGAPPPPPRLGSVHSTCRKCDSGAS